MNQPYKDDSPSSSDERLNEVLAEYLIAIEDGDQSRAEELEHRYPEYQADLNSFVSNKRLIDRLAETRMKMGKARPSQPDSGKSRGGIPEFEPISIQELEASIEGIQVVALLGRGAMGAVYKAKQTKLNRWVAIKILPKQAAEEAQFIERFNREARAMARLVHSNILTIYDFGQSNDICYLVMELVDGVNLRQAMQASEVRPSKALEIVGQICDALSYAHQNGVVHRDIKPENILLDRFGNVKIADFGLAKVLDDNASQFGLTATQQVLGTYRYMAPEQLTGSRDIDHRADIYSLGVVFYELLTGQVPMGKFQLPSESSDVDQRIDPVVSRALEQNPDRRYQQASDVKTDISRLTEQPIESKAVHNLKPKQDLSKASSEVPLTAGGGGVGFPIHNIVMIMLSAAVAVVAFSPWKHFVKERELTQVGGFEFLSVWFGVTFCVALIGWIVLDFWKSRHWLRATWAIAAGLATVHAAILVGFTNSVSRLTSHPFQVERYLSIELTIGLGVALILVGFFELNQSRVWTERTDLLSRSPLIRQQLSNALRLTVVLSIIFSLIAVVRTLEQGHFNEQIHQLLDPYYAVSRGGYFDTLTAVMHLAYSLLVAPVVWLASTALRNNRGRTLVFVGCLAAMVPMNYAAALALPVAGLILMLLAHDEKGCRCPMTTSLVSHSEAKRWIRVVGIANLVAAIGTTGFFSFVLMVEWYIGQNAGSSFSQLLDYKWASSFAFLGEPLLAQSSGLDESRISVATYGLLLMISIPIGLGCVHAFASVQMIRLQSYYWSLIAIAVGLIPFTFFWILSAPFSLWCLFFMRQEFSSDSKPVVVEARGLFVQ